MLVHRLQRWSNNEKTFDRLIVFAGLRRMYIYANLFPASFKPNKVSLKLILKEFVVDDQ